jgi:phosphatidylserine/phosphatidylglycerophosphate/cardiolipin synthase-like enzyme
VDRAASVREDSSTDFSQESRIMISDIRDSEIGSSNINLASTSQETPTTSANNEQSGSISHNKLQEILNNVMQGIKESARQTAEESREQAAEESRKQTAALQEEFKKQTAAQDEFRKQTAEESAKLTSAVEGLRAEIKEENKKLADSLTAKFEAAHHKIREDSDAKLTSEIITICKDRQCAER